jgi:hypothetical protein
MVLRSRFVQIEQTFWQRLTLPVSRLKWKLKRALRNLVDRLLAKKRNRAYLDKYYPFVAANSIQPGQWVHDASSPRGRRWEGQRRWRSRIGRVVVCWECGSPAGEAWNVRMPDGTRRHVRWSPPYWRRRSEPPLVWTYGRLVTHPDDVEFVDLDQQPGYDPPEPKDLPNLEAEVARSPAFVADLQDDAFALTVFFELTNREWMKIGHRDVETFSSGDQLAGMIAGLRGKGEISSDVRYQTLSGRLESLERGICSPDRVQRLHQHLAAIGWRTHTPDEIQAVLREDLHRRLRIRVKLLRDVKNLESRPAGCVPAWREEARFPAVPMPIYYEGDDPAWLGKLSAEEREACSGQLSLRLLALATSARIGRDEYEELSRALFGKML